MSSSLEKEAIDAMIMMKQSLYERRCGFLKKARELRSFRLAQKKDTLKKRGEAVSKTVSEKSARKQQIYEMRCAIMATVRAARGASKK
jgi:hypothetical protein